MKKLLLSLLTLSIIWGIQAQTVIKKIAVINTTPKDSDHGKPVAFNGKLYFSGRNNLNTEYLYSYDGVNPPTLAQGMVENTSAIGRNPGDMIVFQNKLYYNGYVTWKGNELIVYDGTNAPTLVADIYNAGQASSSPSNFKIYNNKLYFSATTATGTELWAYDGTNAPSKVPSPRLFSSPKQLTVYKSKLYFTALDGLDEELFEYDGTSPIKKYNINALTTGNSFTTSSRPKGLVIFKDTLFFGAKGTDGITELYKFSQGDSFQLARIYAGPKRHTYPSNLVVYKGKLYYSGVPRFGNYDLIEYDGINDPKVLFAPNGTYSSHPQKLTVVNNILYFNSRTPTSGYELFKYNGVDTPTLVIDMLKGIETSNPDYFTKFGNKLVYLATDTISGRELRSYDGINPPQLISDFTSGTESSQPTSMVNFNNKMYFHATTGAHGKELWEYDGTNTPTIVSDYTPGKNGSISAGARPMVVYKNKLIYMAERYGTSELVAYDGTNSPTPISNMYTQGFRTTISYMTVFKDNLYFDGFKFNGRRQLYKYDGDTILLVSQINSTGDANPGGFFEYKDKIYFSADNGTDGRELWTYDGTNAPSMVANINASGHGSPHSFQELNDTLYFIANNGNDSKIFKYDGTNTPSEISQGNLRSMYNLTKYKNELYFSSWDVSSQPELYSFDGTNPPKLVVDIRPGNSGSSPSSLKVYNGKLYFSGSHDIIGREMWSYDGTDTASFDIVPGIDGSNPQNLHVFNGILYFSALDNTDGYELFSLEAPSTQMSVKNLKNSSVTIYPNPTSGIVNIKTNERISEIKMLNAIGKTILTSTQQKFNIAHLSKGVYIIQINAGGVISSQQIIKY